MADIGYTNPMAMLQANTMQQPTGYGMGSETAGIQNPANYLSQAVMANLSPDLAKNMMQSQIGEQQITASPDYQQALKESMLSGKQAATSQNLYQAALNNALNNPDVLKAKQAGAIGEQRRTLLQNAVTESSTALQGTASKEWQAGMQRDIALEQMRIQSAYTQMVQRAQLLRSDPRYMAQAQLYDQKAHVLQMYNATITKLQQLAAADPTGKKAQAYSLQPDVAAILKQGGGMTQGMQIGGTLNYLGGMGGAPLGSELP